jgi:Predicted membrane protein
VLWLAASALFSFYAANFGNFNETYGSLGAVIGFMTWLWISAIVVLLGAELDAEMEHQTARDSTTGTPKPLGNRGARMADSVGAAQTRRAKTRRSGQPTTGLLLETKTSENLRTKFAMRSFDLAFALMRTASR